MLSNAQQQPQGIVPVPDPVDSPLHLVDRHFIEPMPGQEGGRRKHPSHACFICNVSKEDYTSEILKIARMSVKPIQKDAQHV